MQERKACLGAPSPQTAVLEGKECWIHRVLENVSSKSRRARDISELRFKALPLPLPARPNSANVHTLAQDFCRILALPAFSILAHVRFSFLLLAGETRRSEVHKTPESLLH